MGEIRWQYNNLDTWLMRIQFGDYLIYDNTNPNVKITTATSSHGTRTMYNSCFCHYINQHNDDVICFCLFFSQSTYCRLQYTSDGGSTWSTQNNYEVRKDPNSNYYYVYNHSFSPLFEITTINGIEIPYQYYDISTIVGSGILNISGCHFVNDLSKYAKYVLTPKCNWQSVPSITGKGKTVNLSTLNDINDGEPVTTSDTTKFDLTNDSNVYNLVKNNL